MKKALHGFTLVELLVVIAIISILAGLLLPALDQALGSARTIACMNNLKQMHLGVTLYMSSTEEFFPRGNQGGGLWGETGVSGNGWLSQVYPEIDSVEVISCPNDEYSTGLASQPTLSYFYSQNLAGGEKGNTWKPTPWRMPELSNPSNTVLLWESTKTSFTLSGSNSKAYSGWHERGGWPASGVLYGLTGSASWKTDEWINGARHGERSNFLSAGGHVSTLHGQEVSGGQTSFSATHSGGGFTQARGARACNDGVRMTMSPR